MFSSNRRFELSDLFVAKKLSAHDPYSVRFRDLGYLNRHFRWFDSTLCLPCLRTLFGGRNAGHLSEVCSTIVGDDECF
jgi:hypothetical protein